MGTSTKRAGFGVLAAVAAAALAFGPTTAAFADDVLPPDPSVVNTEVATPTEPVSFEELTVEKPTPVEQPAPEPPAEPLVDELPAPDPAPEPVEQEAQVQTFSSTAAPEMRVQTAEFVGTVGELLPWSSATNQPSYWEDYGSHDDAMCYKHSGNSDHGSITNGGKTVTLNAYQDSWPGDHWELLVVKGGNVSNNVIVHPQAGVAYASPNNASGNQSNVSHWIVCKGTTPPPPDVCKNIDGTQETVPSGYIGVGDKCYLIKTDVEKTEWVKGTPDCEAGTVTLTRSVTTTQYYVKNGNKVIISSDTKTETKTEQVTEQECPPVKEATPIQPTAEAGIAQCVDGQSVGTNGTITLKAFEGGYWAEVPATADGDVVLNDVVPSEYFFTAVAEDGYELVPNEIDGVETNLWSVTVPESTPVDCEQPPIVTNPDWPNKVCPADPQDPPYDFPGLSEGPVDGEDNTYDSGNYFTVVDDQRDADGAGDIVFTFVPKDGVEFDPELNDVNQDGTVTFVLTYDGTECDPEPEPVIPSSPTPVDECGTEDDDWILPDNTGQVSYEVIEDEDGPYVVGTPAEGYSIANLAGTDYEVIDGKAVWTHEFTNELCPTNPPEEPEKPEPKPKPEPEKLANTGANDPSGSLALVAGMLVLGVALVAARRVRASQQ